MDSYAAQRSRLVDTLRKQGISDERVLKVVAEVPRECFVPPELQPMAYENIALSIGHSQTISQPYIVAVMTEALELRGDEKVLEIGTGSGYQTAILCKLCRQVVSIERLPALSGKVASRLKELGCLNVELHTGDGTLGWEPSAPYDAIIVTAGSPDVPSPLYHQLNLGGRLVIPVGDEISQDLQVIEKFENGPRVTIRGGCRFVKLIGDAGWDDIDER